MALVSAITPLASRSCPHKSLAKSTNELKALPRTVPTLRLFDTRGKSIAPSIIMCLTPAVERRVANHHANLWGDDFIQSLSTPYGAPSYLERAQRIIGEVKEIIKSISVDDGIIITPLNDLLQRLSIVDSVERLGIHRHFKNEIKLMLDYVYSYWNEKGIGCGRDSAVTDLNSTSLGLRILRLHGYLVSSDVLEYFKDQKGQFVCSSKFETGDIRSVLNLFRASLVAFPSEKIMEEAEIFSTTYLKEALQKVPVSSLSRQIEYFIEYGWHTNLLRLETRNFIDLFGKDNIEMPYMIVEKLLELAKLEFNIFHSLQQEELKHISRWWKDSGFPELTFARHRHVEYYTLASCFATDPNQSAFRLGFAKNCHLITVLDDIYDTFGTMEELKLFTAAVKRWDPSATEWLPEYMKGLYVVLYQTVNEMAGEADKSQGRETIHYVRQAWEAYIDSYMKEIDSYMKEAEWISSGFLPTFGEYYENGKVSFGYGISKLQPMLMLDVSIPHNILQEIDFPSRLNDLAAGILRLKGDTRCYKADRENGEEASCISCYMKDNPESTEEDALNHINTMVKNLIKELNWELLRPDNNVPISLKKLAVDIAKDRDGYSLPKNEIKNLVMITVLETVPL